LLTSGRGGERESAAACQDRRVPPLTPDPYPGSWVADLHIHSRHSMACSKDLDLHNLAWWGRRKGIALLGTGDVTHPAWREHLRDTLVEAAEPGLFRLHADHESAVRRKLPPRLAAESDVRFMLSVEISTIYKAAERTRKVHHLIYLPSLAAADRFAERLARVGNIASDGRPILGLPSRDLLEIALEADPDAYLVPAHIWTPWFSALGSKSGYDAIADCYEDLADHIFAVETGLSSDPEMNWRVSSLDRYALVSNSDAHSPQALAREATLMRGPLDYYAVRDGLRDRSALVGTVEFFPEEGKYHGDGHRACGVNWTPAQTRSSGGLCSACGKPVTVGVLARVEELADRPTAPLPTMAVEHLVQLPEILGEIHGVGPRTRTVDGKVTTLVAALGPELHILRHSPLDEIGAVGGELLAEGVRRLRTGQVRRTPGYDGEYGVIRLFDDTELAAPSTADALFDLPAVPVQRKAPAPAPVKPAPARGPANKAETPPAPMPPAPPAPPVSPHEPFEPMLAGMEEVGTGLLDRLDAMQRVAASAPGGPLLIVAGPGTGKTRTLTHRIAYLCAELHVFPERCLAVTFTRRAAEELRERLKALLGPVSDDVTVTTFHALALSLLREQDKNLTIVDQAAPGGVTLDELLPRLVALLKAKPALATQLRTRWQWVFVDEYQDVDETQYELLRILVPPDGNLCAIGDPDQAIYSFRGADVRFFLRFAKDFTDARVVRLTRNYRSSAPIIAAAVQAIAPTSLVAGRRLDPAKVDPEAPLIGRYAAGSAAEEADFVARTVDELVGGLSHRTRSDTRGVQSVSVSFADIAVLYRTDAQSASIVDALHRAGIPVQKRSHDRLRDRVAVAAIAAELRLAATNPAGEGSSLPARVKQAAQVLAERPALDSTLTPDELWAAVELLTPLARRCEKAGLGAFLAEIALGAEVDALDPRAEAVTLLTLHAAKGLEFPVVFVAGCEDGLLPLRLPGAAQRSTPEELAAAEAEERRLFFVGITRAQRRLYLTHSAKRYRHGSERECAPTPFLAAIDAGLLEWLGDSAPVRRRDQQLRLI
jgi:ATP-dependent DNA helicase UvrD/PcrA